jgi:hypothetical protein
MRSPARERVARFLYSFISLILVCGLSAICAGQDTGLETIQPAAIRAHMRFLADDLLEGRGTGTRGHEIAAEYMATQFEGMGLVAAGDSGSYFQNVPLRTIRTDNERSALIFLQGGKEQPLIIGRDFIMEPDPARKSSSVEAPIVFVGYGVTASSLSHDDYAGVDVRGKIIAYVSGAPAQFEPALRAHYSSRAEKAANAARHGAVGILMFDSPDAETMYPFMDRVHDQAFPAMRWLDPDGRPNDYYAQLAACAILSMEGTTKIFGGAGKSMEEVFAAVKKGGPVAFPLGVSAKMTAESKLEDTHSVNVVARLDGSDAQLGSEYVVFTAHLDHLGIGEPVNGDSIYNGALDDASGSAYLLEIARGFSRLQPRPKRSVLFASVTGEEKGLLGSDYFVHYPTVPKEKIVADINMDGISLLWPMEDVVARGAEHSTLSAPVRQAATRLRVDLSPDAHPEQLFFIRSDQYSFVKQGIPSLAAASGFKSSNPAIRPEEAVKAYRQTGYHKPQDDMNRPMDFEAGAKYARFNFLVGYFVAEEKDRPKWNTGDFFGTLYTQPVP